MITGSVMTGIVIGVLLGVVLERTRAAGPRQPPALPPKRRRKD